MARLTPPGGLLPPALPAPAVEPWSWTDLAGLESLEDLFDNPLPDPPPGPPPYHSGGSREGAVGDRFAGLPASTLVAALTGLEPAAAAELISFGTLWLGERVMTDPARPLAPGPFRLRLPRYEPRIFYEVDPSRIVYHDGDLIVYHKEAGRPSQNLPYDALNNVHAALERHTGLTLRLPHRLDAPTSGLLMAAASKHAAVRLGTALAAGAIRKRYLALAKGEPPPWRERLVDAPIGKIGQRYVAARESQGKPARTRLTLLASRGDDLLLMAEPLTGRTHQIRIHMAEAGYPIAGDELYGGRPDRRLMLRASGLSLRHPGDARPLILGGPWPENVVSEAGTRKGSAPSPAL